MTVFKKLLELIERGWEILNTVYSYNSVPWRLLKAGALIVFGFFNFMAGNLLYSYKPDWNFLKFFMAYGSLLIVYGPIHHLVVIPGSLKLGRYSWARNLKIPQWGHVILLVTFFSAVVYFSVFPMNFMIFEIEAQGMMGATDIDPEVTCWRPKENSTTIKCTVSHEPGIDYVDLQTRDKTVLTSDTVPHHFSVDESNIDEVVGQKTFSIIPRDKHGNILRRYVQQVDLLEHRTQPDTF